MTQTSNRLFDEMARLMGDAANVAQGVKREAETAFRSQIERFVADMDLVKREEFDVVREMASKARSENTALKRRLSELEKQVAALGGAPVSAKSASAKSASAKSASTGPATDKSAAAPPKRAPRKRAAAAKPKSSPGA